MPIAPPLPHEEIASLATESVFADAGEAAEKLPEAFPNKQEHEINEIRLKFSRWIEPESSNVKDAGFRSILSIAHDHPSVKATQS